MNLFKLIPQKFLPGIIKAGVKAYQPPARGKGKLSGMMSDYVVPSVQARWLGAGISWYTPQMVEYIYRMALSGDLQSQWEMFDMMESTWPELSKCENELKDAVCDLLNETPNDPFLDICPFGEEGATPEAIRRADLVRQALFSMRPRPASDENGLEGTLRDIMDARFKGLAVLEIDWEPRNLPGGSALCPRATRWVHPSWYGYPFGPGNERLFLKLGGLRMDNEFSPSGQPSPLIQPLPMGGNLPPIQNPMNFYGAGEFVDFPPNKFIIAVSKSKSGHPLGGAMLHILAWYWASMNFSLEWFLNFVQLFGQPIRWANYSAEMDEQDQAKLELLLQHMGSSAWAMFPDDVKLEMKEASARAADNPQIGMIDLANKAARNLILRQSLTSDTGDKGSGSMALGKVHAEVLDSVKIGCGRWSCGVLNQLIEYFCILNFGNTDQCPVARIVIPSDDESLQVSEAAANLTQAGLEPDDEGLVIIGKKMGYSIRRKAPTETSPDPDAKISGALKARAASTVHPSDAIADARAPALSAALLGAHAPLRNIILTSRSREEMVERATAMYSDWKPARVHLLIEEALQASAQAAVKETGGTSSASP